MVNELPVWQLRYDIDPYVFGAPKKMKIEIKIQIQISRVESREKESNDRRFFCLSQSREVVTLVRPPPKMDHWKR